ncbi:MAG: AI-2E family transporter [Candidatus Caenarcaniphilales bacterium]|nr:AI-2E family transporter [Candidatus Caenarcaniphilales bacterium]
MVKVPKKNKEEGSPQNPEEQPSGLQHELILWQKRFFHIGFFILFGFTVWAITELCGYFNQVTSIIGYSILIAYLLIGAVDWIQNKTFIKKRGLVVLIVYLILFSGITLFSIYVIPTLIHQLESLASQVPIYFKKLQELLINYNLKIMESDFPYRLDLTLLSREISKFLGGVGPTALNQFVELAFNTINFAVAFLVTIVLSIYFLIDGPKIWNGLMRPLSSKYHEHSNKLRSDLSRCLRGYFIGQIQLSSLSGIYVFFMYLAMGSKYALLLGIWQAIVEIIPVVGGFIGIGLGMIVLLFNPDPWFGNPLIKSIAAFGIYIFYTQIIKDNLLTPRIMGNAIGLHPVVVILVVFVGAKIGGVNGVVFALPIAGILNVLFDYYLKNRYKRKPNIIVEDA